MSTPIFVADAFTSRAFSGNPAAVCILPALREEIWMLRVAREMKHSETAFVAAREAQFDIRWFTPETEVPLCGHATLASAHILWEHGYAPPDQHIHFSSKSGILSARRNADWIELDFPVQLERPWTPPSVLEEALGVKPRYVGRNESTVLALLDSERTVRELKPDFRKLKSVDSPTVVVTAPAEMSDYDFVLRTFAPRLGIDEDPATGSVHCSLAPFWQFRLHKNQFTAYQASSRGGKFHIRISEERIHLGGQAVTVLKGELQE